MRKIIRKIIQSRIVEVEVKYVDFSGTTRTDTIEVNKRIASDVKETFDDLYRIDFPINIVHKSYNRPDDQLIDNNITTGYNFRTVMGKDTLSKHAFGLAFDINPKNNPAKPSKISHVYDESIKKGKLNKEVIELIKLNGFQWGGEIFGKFWDSHHFEVKYNWYEKFLSKAYKTALKWNL